jgi:hypothetical protein
MPNKDDFGLESMRKLSYFVVGGMVLGAIISGIIAYYSLR